MNNLIKNLKKEGPSINRSIANPLIDPRNLKNSILQNNDSILKKCNESVLNRC